MIKTIPNTMNNIRVTYSPEYSVICSVSNVSFSGKMNIEYQPDTNLLEFESFEMWLRSLTTTQITIEGLAHLVSNELIRVLGDIPLRVTVYAQTTVHAPVSTTIEMGWY